VRFLQDKKSSFLERSKEGFIHLLFIWTASYLPEVPSLKLIKVPFHNSAKNQRFFLSRLVGSRALPSEDITGLKQKILAEFSQIFPTEKLSRSLRSARALRVV
jgi:hypothetical protein